jgi:hypothetical protein
MKFYCIIPATKDKEGVCVLPTMQEPTRFPFLGYTERLVQNHKLKEWKAHLSSSLPKFPTSCDRVGWFEGNLGYQVMAPTELGGQWYDCSEEHYRLCSNPERRRKFIVPQYEEKDGPVEQKDEPNGDALFYCQSEKDGNERCETICSYCAIHHSPKVEPQPKTYTESEVREIVGRTWEAAQKWEWVENRNQERVDEGSTHWVNPCPGKETFINTLLPSGR